MSWFRHEDLGQGLYVIRQPGYGQELVCYLVEGNERAAVIDAGHGVANLREYVAQITSLEPILLLTHGHVDHAGGAHHFGDVRMHPADSDDVLRGWTNQALRADIERFFGERELPASVDPSTFEIPPANVSRFVQDQDVIDLGGRQLDVFHTPGHSPGSLVFLDLEWRLLFTGDSLLHGRLAILDTRAYRTSIGKIGRLAQLADRIFPAHGPTPLAPEQVEPIRRGFYVAMGDRRPDGFLGGMMLYDFGDYGFMLPPKRHRENV